MSDDDKAGYLKLLEELRTMALRLKYLSDAGHDDMEGCDMPEFEISEILWTEMRGAAWKIAEAHRRISDLLK